MLEWKEARLSSLFPREGQSTLPSFPTPVGAVSKPSARLRLHLRVRRFFSLTLRFPLAALQGPPELPGHLGDEPMARREAAGDRGLG